MEDIHGSEVARLAPRGLEPAVPRAVGHGGHQGRPTAAAGGARELWAGAAHPLLGPGDQGAPTNRSEQS